jgi:hypothetical protein
VTRLVRGHSSSYIFSISLEPSGPEPEMARCEHLTKSNSIACIPALIRDWRAVDLIAFAKASCKVNPHAVPGGPCHRSCWDEEAAPHESERQNRLSANPPVQYVHFGARYGRTETGSASTLCSGSLDS